MRLDNYLKKDSKHLAILSDQKKSLFPNLKEILLSLRKNISYKVYVLCDPLLRSSIKVLEMHVLILKCVLHPNKVRFLTTETENRTGLFHVWFVFLISARFLIFDFTNPPLIMRKSRMNFHENQ